MTFCNNFGIIWSSQPTGKKDYFCKQILNSQYHSNQFTEPFTLKLWVCRNMYIYSLLWGKRMMAGNIDSLIFPLSFHSFCLQKSALQTIVNFIIAKYFFFELQKGRTKSSSQRFLIWIGWTRKTETETQFRRNKTKKTSFQWRRTKTEAPIQCGRFKTETAIQCRRSKT